MSSSTTTTNGVGQCGFDGCSMTSNFFCSSCNLVNYCSKGHQIADWKNHKKMCSPLTLQSSTELGRHFVASRNLKAGTLLLVEYPLLVQPLTYSYGEEGLEKEPQNQEEEENENEVEKEEEKEKEGEKEEKGQETVEKEQKREEKVEEQQDKDQEKEGKDQDRDQENVEKAKEEKDQDKDQEKEENDEKEKDQEKGIEKEQVEEKEEKGQETVEKEQKREEKVEEQQDDKDKDQEKEGKDQDRDQENVEKAKENDEKEKDQDKDQENVEKEKDQEKVDQEEDKEKEREEKVVLNSSLNGLGVTLGHGQEGQVSICLACCMPAEGKKCPQCDWPICSIECSKAKIHADNECSIFVKNAFKLDRIDQDTLYGVFFIRGLVLKRSQPEVWDKIQDFQAESSNQTAVFQDRELFPLMISRFQEKFKKLQVEFGQDFANMNELVNFYGIHCRNALAHNVNREERAGNMMAGTGVAILYLKSSMFSHACFPNCTWGVTSGPIFKIEVRTAVDIVKGQILSIAYYPTDSMMGSVKRNLSGIKGGNFDCFCARCLDPTELNSMMSAIKCTKCPNGYLLPKDPKYMTSFSIWTCTICGDKSSETWERINHLTNRAENVTKKFTDFDEIQKIQELLDILRKNLHPNHWVIQQFCRQVMKKLVNSENGQEMDFFVEITRYLEQVCQLIMPGLNYFKAYFQLKLLNALEAKCHRTLNKFELIGLAQESLKILDQLLKVKKFDPRSRTNDGHWRQNVLDLMDKRIQLDFILLNVNYI